MKKVSSCIIILIVLAVAILWLNYQRFNNNRGFSFLKSQEKYTFNENNKPEAKTDPKMEKYKYFCSDGGPFVLITSEVKGKWRGVENILNPLDPKTDYGKACSSIISGVKDGFGIISAHASKVLVVDAPMLAMEPVSKNDTLDIYILKEWKTTDMDSMIEQCKKDLSNKAFRATGETIEMRTNDVTFMWAGDVYGKCVCAFSDFKMQKGKYELLKSEWKDTELGEIVVLRLLGQAHLRPK